MASSFNKASWGTLSLALAVLAAIGMLLIAVAWISLYKYFVSFLLPSFFYGLSMEQQAEFSRGAAELLARAVLYMICAGLMSLVSAILRIGFGGF
jgi:hypothetical protein